jgi:hypothetical protein
LCPPRRISGYRDVCNGRLRKPLVHFPNKRFEIVGNPLRRFAGIDVVAARINTIKRGSYGKTIRSANSTESAISDRRSHG